MFSGTFHVHQVYSLVDEPHEVLLLSFLVEVRVLKHMTCEVL